MVVYIHTLRDDFRTNVQFSLTNDLVCLPDRQSNSDDNYKFVQRQQPGCMSKCLLLQ